jgi:hypothetical protein
MLKLGLDLDLVGFSCQVYAFSSRNFGLVYLIKKLEQNS